MLLMKEHVADLKEKFEKQQDIANHLGVGTSMVTAYKNGSNPSIEIAMIALKVDGVVLHPFSKESLEYEIGKNNGAS